MERNRNDHNPDYFTPHSPAAGGVPKTELLARFCRDKRSIFFVSDLDSEISLRSALSAAVNSTLFGPDRMNAVYSSWEDLFMTLARFARNERLVFVHRYDGRDRAW